MLASDTPQASVPGTVNTQCPMIQVSDDQLRAESQTTSMRRKMPKLNGHALQLEDILAFAA